MAIGPYIHLVNRFHCPRSQSGSGGTGAAGGWEADLGGMGSAFGGMQLSNSAGIVRSAPLAHSVLLRQDLSPIFAGQRLADICRGIRAVVCMRHTS